MELTIPAALARAARVYGDAPAVVDPDGHRLSYLELAHRVGTVARALIALGVRPGDRVALWAPNTHHWVQAALAVSHAGAVLVPVNTRFTGPEALEVVRRSAARCLIVVGPFLGVDRLAALRAAAADEAVALPAVVIRIPSPDGSPDTGPDTGDGDPGTRSASSDNGAGAPGTQAVNPDTGNGSPSHGHGRDHGGGHGDGHGHGHGDGRDHGGGHGDGRDHGGGHGDGRDHGGGHGDGDAVVEWRDLDRRATDVPTPVADARAEAVNPEQVSAILFTSGTTGRSKGAMSAHRQSLALATAWARIGGLTDSDRYLVVNPFFHSFGFKAGILACLVSGATIVPQATFDVDRTMRLVERHRITVLPGPPTIYQSMLDYPGRDRLDLSCLRLAVTGAATVPAALVERMRAELSFDTVLTAYGLTEAVVATMCRPGDDPATVATTSGRAAADFEVRIGADGEILLRGPNVMLGYLDDPAATAAAIDADGWLHTGDVGRLDARGYLSVTDRLKDMYVCGGFNVYPAEVEQVLARLAGVAESAVVGVPDGRLGEVGRAYVVPRPGHQLTADEVLAFCRTRLANYKLPRQVVFRTGLPRNPAGKPLKYLLRKEAP